MSYSIPSLVPPLSTFRNLSDQMGQIIKITALLAEVSPLLVESLRWCCQFATSRLAYVLAICECKIEAVQRLKLCCQEVFIIFFLHVFSTGMALCFMLFRVCHSEPTVRLAVPRQRHEQVHVAS